MHFWFSPQNVKSNKKNYLILWAQSNTIFKIAKKGDFANQGQFLYFWVSDMCI